MSPAATRQDPAFGSTYGAMYKEQLVPAFKRYRDYLEKEYLPAAREDIAVAANPDGLACYAASVRAFSSIPVAPRSVHEIGLRQIDMLMSEMSAIGERTFHTKNIPALMQALASGQADTCSRIART